MTRPQIAKTSQNRIEKVFYLFAGLFVVCGGRVAWMQTMSHASTASVADASFDPALSLRAGRGQLRARDGTAMAVTID